MIQPRKKLTLVEPPKDTVNIALHIREGGGVDDVETQKRMFMKFPPISFYKQGLSHLLSLYQKRSITCHIFTDAKDPSLFVKELKSVVPEGVSVTFGYRTENHHEMNVLEDFFSLFNFDCLIRPQSNFSMIPALLKDYEVVYTPDHFISENGDLKIDKVHIEINQEIYKKQSLSK